MEHGKDLEWDFLNYLTYRSYPAWHSLLHWFSLLGLYLLQLLQLWKSQTMNKFSATPTALILITRSKWNIWVSWLITNSKSMCSQCSVTSKINAIISFRCVPLDCRFHFHGRHYHSDYSCCEIVERYATGK